MTSVITADIIHSRRQADPTVWSDPLKKLLGTLGKTPETWEIYRGDSFQLEIPQPAEALRTAIRIKAVIKCHPGLDVRMAIGIGKPAFRASAIAESNGEAFIYSGEKLEEIKKAKCTLAIRTPWQDFDQEMNLILRLGLIVMDSWSSKAAETVHHILEHPDMDQQHIGHQLGISQSSFSGRRKRAHLDDILDIDAIYRKKVNILVPT